MTVPVNQIVCGDCLEIMRGWPSESVDCCVTSPPYYGLRDYGVQGQLGLEPTPEQYIAAMVAVFEEVRRVLKPTGTLWLNIGDSYSATRWSAGGGQPMNKHRDTHRSGAHDKNSGLPDKNLLMIPARLALALQAAGWYLRSDIIWHKPNPMPESVKDRPTSAHEHIYLLTKSSKYHYDSDAIAEPVTASSLTRLGQDVDSQRGSDRAHAGAKTNGTMKAVCFGGTKGTQAGDASGSRTYSGNEWKPRGSHKGSSFHRGKTAEHQLGRTSQKERDDSSLLRNSRNVWSIATRPFKGAHFATFPPEIPRRCIAAGCPLGGVVLDPFFGSGTVGMVAAHLGRNWLGIELNPEYVEIARARTAKKHPERQHSLLDLVEAAHD